METLFNKSSFGDILFYPLSSEIRVAEAVMNKTFTPVSVRSF